MRPRAIGSASTSYSMNSLRFHSSQSRISEVWGQRAVPKSSSLDTAQDLQRFAHHVINRRLGFLDAGDVVTADDYREIGQCLAFDFAAIVAQKPDRQHVPLARFLQCHDDVA